MITKFSFFSNLSRCLLALGALNFAVPGALGEDSQLRLAPDLGAPDQVRPQIEFDLTPADPVAGVFANQVLELVRENLATTAEIGSDTENSQILNLRIEQNGEQFSLSLSTQSPEGAEIGGEGLEFNSADDFEDADLALAEEADALDLSEMEMAPAVLAIAPYGVRGTFQSLDGQVMEISLEFVEQGAGQPTIVETLVLRADISDWRRVGHAVSNTLYGIITDRSGQFESQIAFVANGSVAGAPVRRLALIDQAGGDLQWLPEAGDNVAYPSYLENRFELSYVDQTDGENALVHLNMLTGRQTPLAQLPDLLGAPSVALGGRLIAFAGLEGELGEDNVTAADIFVADVERGSIEPISIPGSRDSDPHFSPNLDALAFVSTRASWSELIVAGLPVELAVRERTTQKDATPGLETELVSLYGSPYPLRDPKWAPDGGALAFIQVRESDNILLLYNFVSQQVREIAQAPLLSDLTWSPNSDQVAFVLRENVGAAGTLIRLDTTTGDTRVLPSPFDAETPSWSPKYLQARP